MIRKGQWILLPADLVEHMQNLRLSPIGVVPQRDRRPRTISDYSFYFVNADTCPLAPSDAMQFGQALYRLLGKIVAADPRFGPVYLSKIDIADGFYRVRLLPRDILKLGVLFPQQPGEPTLVGFPLVLPMGWVNSPPYFCAATETVADLSNARASTNYDPGPHRLYAVSETAVPERPPMQLEAPSDVAVPLPPAHLAGGCRSHHRKPLCHTEIYVDDYCSAAQGSPRRRRRLKSILLEALDDVFRPLAPGDGPHRQEPASVKKFRKGDGTWSTHKVMLGWLIDTVAGTVTLPAHRVDRLHEILASVPPTQRRVATKVWHKVVGELRSMTLGLPGSRGMFSTLQTAFQKPLDNGHRLRLDANVHAFLDDFRWLAHTLENRPTRIAEIIPGDPRTIGACDAAGSGMGGVHFVPGAVSGTIRPIAWRQRYPAAVTAALVSYDNPSGTISNSDLELAGTVAHHDVLVHATDMREHTTYNLHDNTPAVAWQRKGSTTTTGPAAYLLRIQALHQRFHRYVPRHDYIPGLVNAMADDCSRLWELTDSQFLAYFNRTYPQSVSWELCPLAPPLNSALTSALFETRSAPASFLAVPALLTSTGTDGPTSVAPSISILGSTKSTTRSLFSKFSVPDTVTGDLLPAKQLSALVPWTTPYAPSVRRSPAWGPRIYGKTRSAA